MGYAVSTARDFCYTVYMQLKSKVYTLCRICIMLIYFTKIKEIIQNACYCLFRTDLNKIFHIKYV